MAELIQEAMPQFAPTSNLYRLADGRHVVITAPDANLPVPAGAIPVIMGFKVERVRASPTDVFLADEDGTLIDADGDPLNGMTPILRCAPGTTHEQALAELEASG